ncbi:unnamed protein product, partial [Discosporangium mesarthrocarpum]
AVIVFVFLCQVQRLNRTGVPSLPSSPVGSRWRPSPPSPRCSSSLVSFSPFSSRRDK